MVLEYKVMHAFDNYKTMKIIYSMYRAGEVSVYQACCERATQPYSLGGGGTIYPGSRPAGVTTRSPRMVTECLLTRSMLIKMYLPLHGGERGGSVVECRTPEREVRGSRPTAAVLCPWARHFTPRKYWLITQEAMAPSRYDWKIVDWDVKPQHNQPTNHFMVCAVYVHCIYSQSVSCRCSLSLFGLSNCINVFVWHNNSIRKHECKTGQGQPRVMNRPFGSGEDFIYIYIYIFFFLPYIGMAVILVIWPGPFEQTFVPHPIEAPYEIWLWFAQWFLRRYLKSVDD